MSLQKRNLLLLLMIANCCTYNHLLSLDFHIKQFQYSQYQLKTYSIPYLGRKHVVKARQGQCRKCRQFVDRRPLTTYWSLDTMFRVSATVVTVTIQIIEITVELSMSSHHSCMLYWSIEHKIIPIVDFKYFMV